jgi:hypothetical protein
VAFLQAISAKNQPVAGFSEPLTFDDTDQSPVTQSLFSESACRSARKPHQLAKASFANAPKGITSTLLAK